MKTLDQMSVVERLQAPTPPFFRRLRLWAILLGAPAAVVAALASGGLAVPAIVAGIAKGIAAVGTTAAAISTLTVQEPPKAEPLPTAHE